MNSYEPAQSLNIRIINRRRHPNNNNNNNNNNNQLQRRSHKQLQKGSFLFNYHHTNKNNTIVYYCSANNKYKCGGVCIVENVQSGNFMVRGDHENHTHGEMNLRKKYVKKKVERMEDENEKITNVNNFRNNNNNNNNDGNNNNNNNIGLMMMRVLKMNKKFGVRGGFGDFRVSCECLITFIDPNVGIAKFNSFSFMNTMDGQESSKGVMIKDPQILKSSRNSQNCNSFWLRLEIQVKESMFDLNGELMMRLYFNDTNNRIRCARSDQYFNVVNCFFIRHFDPVYRLERNTTLNIRCLCPLFHDEMLEKKIEIEKIDEENENERFISDSSYTCRAHEMGDFERVFAIKFEPNFRVTEYSGKMRVLVRIILVHSNGKTIEKAEEILIQNAAQSTRVVYQGNNRIVKIDPNNGPVDIENRVRILMKLNRFSFTESLYKFLKEKHVLFGNRSGIILLDAAMPTDPNVDANCEILVLAPRGEGPGPVNVVVLDLQNLTELNGYTYKELDTDSLNGEIEETMENLSEGGGDLDHFFAYLNDNYNENTNDFGDDADDITINQRNYMGWNLPFVFAGYGLLDKLKRYEESIDFEATDNFGNNIMGISKILGYSKVFSYLEEVKERRTIQPIPKYSLAKELVMKKLDCEVKVVSVSKKFSEKFSSSKLLEGSFDTKLVVKRRQKFKKSPYVILIYPSQVKSNLYLTLFFEDLLDVSVNVNDRLLNLVLIKPKDECDLTIQFTEDHDLYVVLNVINNYRKMMGSKKLVLAETTVRKERKRFLRKRLYEDFEKGVERKREYYSLSPTIEKLKRPKRVKYSLLSKFKSFASGVLNIDICSKIPDKWRQTDFMEWLKLLYVQEKVEEGKVEKEDRYRLVSVFDKLEGVEFRHKNLREEMDNFFVENENKNVIAVLSNHCRRARTGQEVEMIPTSLGLVFKETNVRNALEYHTNLIRNYWNGKFRKSFYQVTEKYIENKLKGNVEKQTKENHTKDALDLPLAMKKVLLSRRSLWDLDVLHQEMMMTILTNMTYDTCLSFAMSSFLEFSGEPQTSADLENKLKEFNRITGLELENMHFYVDMLRSRISKIDEYKKLSEDDGGEDGKEEMEKKLLGLEKLIKNQKEMENPNIPLIQKLQEKMNSMKEHLMVDNKEKLEELKVEVDDLKDVMKYVWEGDKFNWGKEEIKNKENVISNRQYEFLEANYKERSGHIKKLRDFCIRAKNINTDYIECPLSVVIAANKRQLQPQTRREGLKDRVRKFVTTMNEKLFSPSFLPFGNFHSYLMIKNLEIHYLSNSFVRCDEMITTDLTETFTRVLAHEVNSSIEGNLEQVSDEIRKIAKDLIFYNTRMRFSKGGVWGIENETINDQEFVMEFLKMQISPPFHPTIQNYFEYLKKISSGGETVSYEEKKLRVVQCEPDFCNDFPNTMKKYGSGKKETEVIEFESHSKLDNFVTDLLEEDRDLKIKFPGYWSLLKAFDRAFWMARSIKDTSDRAYPGSIVENEGEEDVEESPKDMKPKNCPFRL